MTVDISVIAPCYNEALNLPELVERSQRVFEKRRIKGEIVLVNDGSKDNTGQVIDGLSKNHSNVIVQHHPDNRGIAAAWETGLHASSGVYICLIDADLQNLPEDVWRLYREARYSNADMVQGWRSHIGRLKDSRFLVSIGLNFILNTLFGMTQRDNKSGFVVCRREVLEDILHQRFKYRYFQTFIAVAAKARGYTIREIETLFESRLIGRSFMPDFPIKVIAGVLWDIVKAFVEYHVLDQRENTLHKFLGQNPPKVYHETLPGWRKPYFRLYMAFMPIHHWVISRHAGDYYRLFKQSQWLSLQEINDYQEIKLRRLIRHSYIHVPYYREQMDAVGLRPQDVNSLQDLQRLPALSKDRVRENLYFDMMSDNHDKKKILKITTSGSSGEPFVCYADKVQLELRWAATLRSMEWTGYRFGDRQMRLWHQTIGMSRMKIARERLDAWFSRRLFIPAFEMKDETLKEFISKLKRWKPVLIDGYAELFNLLAYYLKQHNVDGLRPKGVMSSAQELPEASRRLIEEQFGCGVFDKYGSREFSGIAYECDAHEGHHIVAENYIVEILKDGRPAGPGEVGEVVITDLNNYCMPLIRYRLGDLAVAMDNSKPCPCGRGLPRIGRIEGRVQSIILGTNGTYMPGTFFAHLFKDYDHVVRQYQVIQNESGRIHLKIVKGLRFTPEILEDLFKVLRRHLGRDMQIDVDFVDHIPLVRTGKRMGSISKLNLDFQNIDAKLTAVKNPGEKP
ncbi:MAG: glycosyltransferase [Thermodesulfobacteriota bacterium]